MSQNQICSCSINHCVSTYNKVSNLITMVVPWLRSYLDTLTFQDTLTFLQVTLYYQNGIHFQARVKLRLRSKIRSYVYVPRYPATLTFQDMLTFQKIWLRSKLRSYALHSKTHLGSKLRYIVSKGTLSIPSR